jgi:putative nucleotidyltransferase with HDIG domain
MSALVCKPQATVWLKNRQKTLTTKQRRLMEREKALELLRQYNKESYHIQHALTVEAVMKWYAEKLGYDAEYWGIIGLLHDLDYEMYPQEHCIKAVEILQSAGYGEDVIHAVCSHGYNVMSDVRPEHEMEKILYAVDELTGLIGTAALMRPSKSVADMELKSLKKKFKDKAFAAGCSRDVIKKGAEILGWELDTLLSNTLEAMRATEGIVAKH